jgi:hypothetical protein
MICFITKCSTLYMPDENARKKPKKLVQRKQPKVLGSQRSNTESLRALIPSFRRKRSQGSLRCLFAKSVEVEASSSFTLSKFFSSLKIEASSSLLFLFVETKKQRTTSQEQGFDSDLLLLFYFFFTLAVRDPRNVSNCGTFRVRGDEFEGNGC